MITLLPPVQQQALASIIIVIIAILAVQLIGWRVACEIAWQRKRAAYHRDRAQHRKPAPPPQFRLALPAPRRAQRLAIEAPKPDGGLATVRAIDLPRPETGTGDRAESERGPGQPDEPFVGEPVHLPHLDRPVRWGRKLRSWWQNIIRDDTDAAYLALPPRVRQDIREALADLPRPGMEPRRGLTPDAIGQAPAESGPGQPDGDFWGDDDDATAAPARPRTRPTRIYPRRGRGLRSTGAIYPELAAEPKPEPQFIPGPDWAPTGLSGSEDTLTGVVLASDLVAEFYAKHPEWAS
jgi:hypothetical protein